MNSPIVPSTSTTRPRTGRAVLGASLAVLAALLLLAGCSSSDGASDGDGDRGGDGTTIAPGDASAASADDGRVVVIGEEYVLGDLLALGVEPVAATATVADQGFQGLDEFDTEGIEPLPATEANLERLASLRPEHIVVLEFFATEIGLDQLEGIAEQVTVVPDGLGPVEQVEFLADAFGREDAAVELVEQYDAAMARSAAALDGLELSVAAIYGGPSLAAFVDGPWAVPATLLASGSTLVPTGDGLEPDQNGRVYLSLEQMGLLTGDQLLLLTSPIVEGESEAIAQIESNPLWDTLPAVQADAVIEMDRLGYPGIVGETRLADELVERLG